MESIFLQSINLGISKKFLKIFINLRNLSINCLAEKLSIKTAFFKNLTSDSEKLYKFWVQFFQKFKHHSES